MTLDATPASGPPPRCLPLEAEPACEEEAAVGGAAAAAAPPPAPRRARAPPPPRPRYPARSVPPSLGLQRGGGSGEGDGGIAAALAACRQAPSLLVFSGAGLSASAGMSAFSSPGGLYERARLRFGLDKGVRLFYASFFASRRRDAQAFLADLFCEAAAAAPTRAHAALEALGAAGRLVRHVTLNVDGLHRRSGGSARTRPEAGQTAGGGGPAGGAAAAGASDGAPAAAASLWSPSAPDGAVMELHGCVLEVVCESCGGVGRMSHALARAFRDPRPDAPQPVCDHDDCVGLLRPRVMLYDDPDEDLITPEAYEEALAADVARAGALLWVGLSFEQSASVEHFRRARRALQAAGRDTAQVPQVVVNPDGDALFNVANTDELRLLPACMTADDFLGALAGLPPPPPGPAAAAQQQWRRQQHPAGAAGASFTAVAAAAAPQPPPPQIKRPRSGTGRRPQPQPLPAAAADGGGSAAGGAGGGCGGAWGAGASPAGFAV